MIDMHCPLSTTDLLTVATAWCITLALFSSYCWSFVSTKTLIAWFGASYRPTHISTIIFANFNGHVIWLFKACSFGNTCAVALQNSLWSIQVACLVILIRFFKPRFLQTKTELNRPIVSFFLLIEVNCVVDGSVFVVGDGSIFVVVNWVEVKSEKNTLRIP